MKYIVDVSRTEWQIKTFEVEAASKEEAKQLAIQKATDTVFERNPGEYAVEACEPAQA